MVYCEYLDMNFSNPSGNSRWPTSVERAFYEVPTVNENGESIAEHQSEAVSYDEYQKSKADILMRLNYIESHSNDAGFSLRDNPAYRDLTAAIKLLPNMDGYEDNSKDYVQNMLTSRFESLKRLLPLLKTLENQTALFTRKTSSEEVAATAPPQPVIKVVPPTILPDRGKLILTKEQRVYPENLTQSPLLRADDAITIPVESELSAMNEIKAQVEMVGEDGTTLLSWLENGKREYKRFPTTLVLLWKDGSEDFTEVDSTVTRPPVVQSMVESTAATMTATHEGPLHRRTLAEMVAQPYSEDELLTQHLYDENIRPYIPAALMELGMSPNEAEQWLRKSIDKIVDRSKKEGTSRAGVAFAVNY